MRYAEKPSKRPRQRPPCRAGGKIMASAVGGVATLIAAGNARAGGTFLFDATKAEMAANADWVVDADLHNIGTGTGGAMTVGAGTESNPQQFPTPSNPSAETDWQGALSSWGVALVQNGYGVQSLPYNGRITYGDSTNSQDLSNYKVFVVDEPNILFASAEKTAMLQFVKNGGGLVMISDHSGSDRNSDGADSPVIWNDFFNNNGNIANPFGIQFNNNNVSGDYTFVNSSANSPIITGIGGTITHITYSNGSEITIDTTKNSTVKAAIWSASGQANNHVVTATAQYGLGRVVAIGDSSPMDDGTGDPNDSLFVGWPSEGGKEACLNGSAWAAVAVANGIWTGTANASWTTGANWSNGLKPTSADAVAFNTPIPSGTGTITIASAQTAASIAFNDNYTLTGGSLTVAGGTVSVSPGLTPTIATPLVGTGALTKTGAGSLVLTGSNTYSGVTTISGGTLQIGNGSNTGSIASANVTDNASLIFNRVDTFTYGGAISGSGSLTKLGGKTLVLTGSNTYTGGTTVSAGTLQIGVGGTAGSVAGNIAVNGAEVSFVRSDTVTFGGVISGNGTLTQSGPGTLVLSASNTFTGPTNVTSGTLRLASGSGHTLSDSTAVFLGIINATLDLNGASETIGSLRGGGAGSGNVSLGAGTLTTGGNNASTTYGGSILGAGGLVKVGAGAMTLTGTSTYSGGTSINGGSLVVNNDVNLGSAGGALSLNGGTLQLAGTLNGTRKITLGAGGGTVDTNEFDGTFGAIDPGVFTKNGSGTMHVTSINATSLTINNGVLHVLPTGLSPAATSVLASVPVIAGSGQLDLEDNALVVNYSAGETTHATRDAIRNLLINGRNGAAGSPGAWNGLGGIGSTYANANGNGFNLAIGYADNSDLAQVRASGSYTSFGGQTVASNTVLVQLTRGADATLDGVVDSQDVTIIGTHFNKPGSGQWCFGDFDYSGTCDSTDVTTLGTTFGKTSPALSPAQMTAEFGAAFTQAFDAGQNGAVPEPGSLTVLGVAGMALATSRRRRRGRAAATAADAAVL